MCSSPMLCFLCCRLCVYGFAVANVFCDLLRCVCFRCMFTRGVVVCVCLLDWQCNVCLCLVFVCPCVGLFCSDVYLVCGGS